MVHVIYNRKSFSLYKKTFYSSERVAKAVLTRAAKRGDIVRDEWTVASKDVWYALVPLVPVTDLMSGKPVLIRLSDKGNPALDPSMEGYWQM